jgi:hypothetical protein
MIYLTLTVILLSPLPAPGGPPPGAEDVDEREGPAPTDAGPYIARLLC